MDSPHQLLSFLNADRTEGYGRAPIPSPIDANVRTLVANIASAAEADRMWIIGQLHEHHGFVLTAFAERMAAYAVRVRDRRFIHEGLSALGIAAHVLDVREVVPILSLLHHSARILGVDPQIAFSIQIPATAEFQSVVDGFHNRSEEDRSISAMGYVEERDGEGFRYHRTW